MECEMNIDNHSTIEDAEKHPTIEDIIKYHLCESDAWKHSAENKAPLPVQKKICRDKMQWHLRAAAEILTHAPKKETL